MGNTSEETYSGLVPNRLQAHPLHYEVLATQPVAEFLQRHPFVGKLLDESVSPLRQIFGSDVVVLLELLEDEDAPEHPELFATVRTALPPEGALAKLDEFDRVWWLDASPRASGRLNFTVEAM